MILDIARTQRVVFLAITLELFEQHRRRLAEDIDQHVEASAVRHAHDHFFDALAARVKNGLVQQWNQAVAALQRETLLADVACMQVFFEAFRRGQHAQDTQTFLVRDNRDALRSLEAFL